MEELELVTEVVGTAIEFDFPLMCLSGLAVGLFLGSAVSWINRALDLFVTIIRD